MAGTVGSATAAGTTSSQTQSVKVLLSQVSDMTHGQAKSAARVIGTLKKYKAADMRELAAQGAKNHEVAQVVNSLIATSDNSSLQMAFDGKGVKVVANTVADMTKPPKGWFFKKPPGTARKVVQEEEKKTPIKSFKTFYSAKGPAIATLDRTYGVTQFAQTVHSGSRKEVEAAGKIWIPKAVEAIVRLQPQITPDNADDIAKAAGEIKGLASVVGISTVATDLAKLDVIIANSNKDAAEQAAKEIENEAKQAEAVGPSSQGAEAGGVGK